LAYLSVPLISFSINKGGDYIDDAVSSVTGTVNTRVRSTKENGFDLKGTPRNDVEDALRIYYDDLIATLVRTLKESIVKTSSDLKFDRPIPVVLSGGTAKVSGFKERFEPLMGKPYLHVGENCSYGYERAIDIVLTLLIDEGIKNLGHRNNILGPDFNSVGVAIRPHKTYRVNCVMDFGSRDRSTINDIPY